MDASPGNASRPFLSLAGIRKRFGGTVALEGIDWSVDTGEVHCLVGENGSGKSTLIKIVSGVHAPDHGGSITIAGSVARRPSDLSGPVALPQSHCAGEHSDRLRVPLAAPAPPRRAMRDAGTAALARLNARLPLDAKVGTLPVAQRQIVAICPGLAANARVLFMDEPTRVAHATRGRRAIGDGAPAQRIGRHRRVRRVSHRLEEIVEIAERVTVLRDGHKVGTFPASEIDDHPLPN